MISDYLPQEFKKFSNKFPLIVHESEQVNKLNEKTLFIAPFLNKEGEVKFSREWQSLKYQLYLKLNKLDNIKLEVANSDLESPIGRLPFLLNNKGEPEIFDDLDNSLKFGKNLNLDDISLLYLIEQKIGLGLDYFIVTDGYENILKSSWFKDNVFPLNTTLSKRYQLNILQKISEKLNNLSHDDILTDIEQILILLNEKLSDSGLLSNDKSLPNELDITLFSILYLIDNLFKKDHPLVKLVNSFEELSKFYSSLLAKVE